LPVAPKGSLNSVEMTALPSARLAVLSIELKILFSFSR
jgi:hypothetical protein